MLVLPHRTYAGRRSRGKGGSRGGKSKGGGSDELHLEYLVLYGICVVIVGMGIRDRQQASVMFASLERT